MTTNPATRPFWVFAGSGLDVKRGYTKSEFESKVILLGKLYCEFRKRIFFDRKWF